LEYLIGKFKAKGHSIADTPENSDAIVINTCGFIEPAVNEAIENILELSEYKKDGKKIIVAGCMVERYLDDFEKEFPDIDYFTGVGNLENIINFLEKKEIINTEVKNFYGQERVLLNSSYFAYLKIAEGCNNKCSYCTIPSIRGDLNSRSMNDIINEAQSLVKQGVKELIIISQDITKYGIDKNGRPQLIELLNQITKIEGDFFVRLLYMNPDGVNENLVDFIASNKKIINYFEIPVQHISDKILKLMNRKSDSKKINNIFAYIRENVKDAIIRTTFIIGFPQETEEDIEKLENFINKYKPDFAGFFPFYPEEGVKASKLEEKVPKKIIRSRISKLQKLQKFNTKQKLKELKKDEIICFVDKANDDFEFILEGRALFQAPEIDGKVYFIDGVADKGFGPYKSKIKRIVYPDIYCKIIESIS
jgi:ribosomal protein S12 methylthiotransferase